MQRWPGITTRDVASADTHPIVGGPVPLDALIAQDRGFRESRIIMKSDIELHIQ